MNIKHMSIACMASLLLASCSDSFLEDKKNYDNVNEDAYNYYDGALGRVSNLYAICLPDANANPGPRNNATGLADDESKSTEEYSGFSVFVDPQATKGTNGNYSVTDYFQGQASSILTSTWGRIRNINDAIAGISNSTGLTESEKNEFLGQCYFLRAWCYYNMVKWYGGVPIIREKLEPSEDSFTPRATTRQTIEFICEDLDKANEMLAPFTTHGGWSSSASYGRVTSGTALALKGRVLLLWASPLFNRKNDLDRWTDAYEAIKASIPVINSCGYGLAYEGDPGTNASNWARIFSQVPCEEGVFVSLYNNIATGGTPDYAHNNNWENGIRPSNSMGGGGKTPSAMMVDLFPMKDGKRPAAYAAPGLEASPIVYDPELPFLDRDPRFYRTFSFPGVRWAFNGDPRNESNRNPYNGSDYELWNYVWYTSADDRDNIESGNTYGADNLLGNAKGMYIRKRTDDLDVNGSCRYSFTQSTGFRQSASPYMEIRYAEVLLNYAEAACGAGKMSEAVEQLKRIRQRVGYTGDCGLASNLSGNQAACMAAILYERQIELAYEGKRFDDMRRWLLFDGGANVPAGASSNFTLTGWDGNTCSWLGFRIFNNQRRENLEFRVRNDYKNGLGSEKFGANGENPDPLAGEARPAAIDYRKDLGPQLRTLAEWYRKYLVRKKKKGDAYTSAHTELFINFKPEFYLLGFGQGAQLSNINLPQNMGWNDYNTGGNGTFDPLAD